MTINYERIVQWVSGPFSVFIGGLATKWVSSWGFLGSLGLPPHGVARSITSAVVFLSASGVTYLGHHKWLTNAALWWQHSGLTLPAVLESDSTPSDKASAPAAARVVPANVADQLRAQLRERGINPEV